MKYKLIATDVDGTIGNDKFQISQENVDAMKKAIAKGIKVILCSGRTPASLQMFEAEMGLNIEGQYGIGFNGATVYDSHTKEILFEDTITQETAVHILNLVRETGTTALVAMYIDSQTMIAEHGLEDVLAMYNTNNEVNIKFYDKITQDMITKDVLNIYCIQYKPVLDPLFTELKTRDLKECTMAFSNENLLEFLPKRMNKAEGISKLCKHLGIDMSEVVTVGDNYNDLEMIQEAGLGIAVANAVPELKNKAWYVTERDNNNHIMIEVVDYVLGLNEA